MNVDVGTANTGFHQTIRSGAARMNIPIWPAARRTSVTDTRFQVRESIWDMCRRVHRGLYCDVHQFVVSPLCQPSRVTCGVLTKSYIIKTFLEKILIQYRMWIQRPFPHKDHLFMVIRQISPQKTFVWIPCHFFLIHNSWNLSNEVLNKLIRRKRVKLFSIVHNYTM